MGNSVNTEEYNGTSWVTVENMLVHKRSHVACGTQTAGLCGGGNPGSQQQVTVMYDGTCWTAGGALASARAYNGAWGSQTAGLVVGDLSYGATSEIYNGSTWSAGDSEPTGKMNSMGLGQSTGGTDGLHHGGEITNASNWLATVYKHSTALTARTLSNS
jgi:hypothetical protein